MSENFNNLFSIQGKTALVTGGSRGIGEMIAAGFLSQGAKVYISSRKAKACEATAERLRQTYGGHCIALPADLSNLAGVESLAAAVVPLADSAAWRPASTCGVRTAVSRASTSKPGET